MPEGHRIVGVRIECDPATVLDTVDDALENEFAHADTATDGCATERVLGDDPGERVVLEPPVGS